MSGPHLLHRVSLTAAAAPVSSPPLRQSRRRCCASLVVAAASGSSLPGHLSPESAQSRLLDDHWPRAVAVAVAVVAVAVAAAAAAALLKTAADMSRRMTDRDALSCNSVLISTSGVTFFSEVESFDLTW